MVGEWRSDKRRFLPLQRFWKKVKKSCSNKIKSFDGWDFSELVQKPTARMAKKKSVKTVKLKINPKYQSVVYALGFLIVLLIISQVIKFAISFNSPQTPAYTLSQQTSQPVWDGKTPVNIVLKSSTVTVLNYNPTDRSLTVLSVPDQTYFQLPQGYGAWPVGSIFKLGEEEQPGRGASLLKESVSSLLGLPIDGFIETSTADSQLDSKNIVSKFRQNPALNLLFLHNLKTDLSPLQLFQLNQHLASLRDDKIVFLDIGTSNITESKLLPDSSRVLGVNAVSICLYAINYLIEISWENLIQLQFTTPQAILA